MLSKTLKITTPIILMLIIIFIGHNSYKKVSKTTESPLNVIPTNAAIILQCNDPYELYNSLNDAEIWEHLRNINLVDSINNQIQYISSFYRQNPLIFESNALFISLHKVGANNSGLLFTSNFERKFITNNNQINTLLGNLVKEWQYNKQPLFELLHKNNILFVSFIGDIVFFSENKMLVEDAIRASVAESKLFTNKSFNTAHKTIKKSAEINLFFNYNSLIEYTNIFTKESILNSDFSGWTATDLIVKKKLISANGFSAFNNNTINYTDIFSNQSPEIILLL